MSFIRRKNKEEKKEPEDEFIKASIEFARLDDSYICYIETNEKKNVSIQLMFTEEEFKDMRKAMDEVKEIGRGTV